MDFDKTNRKSRNDQCQTQYLSKSFKKVTCPFNNCLCIGPEYEGHAEVGRGEGEAAGG